MIALFLATNTVIPAFAGTGELILAPVGITADDVGAIATGGNSGGLAFSNGAVVTSGVVPTSDNLCMLTAASGAAMTFGACSAGTGTVMSVSVLPTSGIGATVTNSTTNPVITPFVNITGILKGSASSVVAASAGSDYLAPSGSGAALTGITASQVGAVPLNGALGTPSSGTATNLTGTASGLSVQSAVNFTGTLAGAVGGTQGATTITALPDSSLATISTASKVANSATTATASSVVDSIVMRDASGNFAASGVTATDVHIGQSPDTTHIVDVKLPADNNITIDGRTNPRTMTGGVFKINHTPAITGTRSIYVDMDMNGYGDTHSLVIDYTLTGLAPGMYANNIQTNYDTANSTGGNADAFDVAKTGTGTGEIWMAHANGGVNPIRQTSGDPVTIEKAFTYSGSYVDTTTAFGSAGTNVTLFNTNSDYVYIGQASTYSSIMVTLATPASTSVLPTFEYSNGAGGWVVFTPGDGTNGFIENGNITWVISNLASWATDTVNAVSGKYWVRIRRTKASVTTKPIESVIKIQQGFLYYWDKNGAIAALSFSGLGTGLTGTASGLSAQSSVNFTGTLAGAVAGTQGATTISALPDSSLATISTSGKVSNSATTATTNNTASAIMARDANGLVSVSGVNSSGTSTRTINGDEGVSANDTSKVHEGNASLCTSGTLFDLVGESVMKYWAHNFGVTTTSNGTVCTMGNREEGSDTSYLKTWGESGKLNEYKIASGSAGSAVLAADGTLVEQLDLSSGTRTAKWQENAFTGTATLPVSAVSSTMINNQGQTATTVLTLPAASTCIGCNFIYSSASSVGATLKIAPNASNAFYFDANAVAAAGSGVISANPQTVGDAIAFSVIRVGASTWAWLVKTVRGTAWTLN